MGIATFWSRLNAGMHRICITRIGILLTAIGIGTSLCFFVPAQEFPTYKVDVNVVNVLATVRDRKGHIVRDLSKDDFILEEDGKPQEIRYFSHQTDLPLTIGLLIDTSLSQVNLLEEERSTSYQFLDQVLRPEQDRAFVIKFDFEAELLQDLTKSRTSLQKALDALKSPLRLRRSGNGLESPVWPAVVFAQNWPGGRGGGGRRGGPYPGGQPPGQSGGTVLFDSVYLASDEILKDQAGRKAIILISDGVDHGSKVKEREAMDAAHRADALIYSIRYYDSSVYAGIFGGEGSKGAKTLKTLSQETGGRMFEVTKKITLKEIYDQIQEELRSQYNIGYAPPDGGGTAFRHIKLHTKDGKLEVFTRDGYYPRQR
jgi:VWFA-related protein